MNLSLFVRKVQSTSKQFVLILHCLVKCSLDLKNISNKEKENFLKYIAETLGILNMKENLQDDICRG